MMKKLLIALAIVSGPAFANQGLNGTYYNPSADSTDFYNFDVTTAYLASNPEAAGTFTATNINYTGGDASSIVSWLGVDGVSFQGTNGSMSDGVITLKGWVNLAAGESLGVNHDDGFRVLLDGTTVGQSGCCGYTGVDISSASAGWHAIEIDYNNALYGDYQGGAFFTVYANGNVVSAADLSTTAVPEAGNGAMLLAGLGMLGLVARRRLQK